MITWEDITDVHPLVLAMAGPLTQHLNGIPSNEVQVWSDVFQINWQGDFHVLPEAPSMSKTFQYITTKSMYQRVKKFFDYRCDDKREHHAFEYFKWDFERQPLGIAVQMSEMHDHYRFMVVPMKYSWDEELDDLRPSTLLKVAILEGQVEFVQQHFDKYDVAELINGIDRAAENGHLDMVKYLHEIGSRECSSWAMDGAALNGHFEVVKWLHENRTEGCTSFAFDEALLGGFMDIVEYLEANVNENYTIRVMLKAARIGNLNAIKHILSKTELDNNRQTMSAVPKFGYRDIVRYFEGRRERRITSAMNEAAARGFLHIVKYLHEKYPDLSVKNAIFASAGNNQWKIVMYLGTNCSTKNVIIAMDEAAKHGRLDVVKRLFEYSPSVVS